MAMRKKSLIVLPVIAGLIVAFFALRGRERIGPALPPSSGGVGPSSPAPGAARYQARSKPPLPGPSTAPATCDVPKVFSTLLARHSAKDKAHYAGGRTRFAVEEAMGLREGRLLALAYPEQFIPLAVAVAADPNRDRWDRLFAVRLLGYLASERHAGAMSALIQLSNQYSGVASLTPETKYFANQVIGQISAADADGRQDGFFAQKCAEGFGTAFYALSHKPSSENSALMNSLMAKNEAEADASLTNRAAVRVQEKYALLQSPDADAWLEECLLNNQSEHFDLTDWALAAARERKMANLPDILRRRLDQSLADARDLNARRRAAGLSPAETFEEQVANSGDVDGMGDRFYDGLLLAHAEMGGTLSDLEWRRLRSFGYFVDYGERLGELLSSQDRVLR